MTDMVFPVGCLYPHKSLNSVSSVGGNLSYLESFVLTMLKRISQIRSLISQVCVIAIYFPEWSNYPWLTALKRVSRITVLNRVFQITTIKKVPR